MSKTNKERRANLTKALSELRKELQDYVKAKRCELRKRPVYLDKDSDICVDRLNDTFRNFISTTYRD
jgi:ribosome recycling factor